MMDSNVSSTGREEIVLSAPFPYFGGKGKCVDIVWSRISGATVYVEPFAGTAIMLLRAPRVHRFETLNDVDSYVANFWRAVRAAPDEVAELLDAPVYEVDLEARHKWLVTAARKREHAERMRDDPNYYDIKIAAWWCWGLCAWIGGGWCEGEWYGRGDARNRGGGINCTAGKLPDIAGDRGIHKVTLRGEMNMRLNPEISWARHVDSVRAWMQALAARLRFVKACCGDWRRVLGYVPTTSRGICAVFLDPPYSSDAGRDLEIYRCEDVSVAHDVREWALEHGRDPKMRIALCGYEGEHVMPDDWECVPWKAQGGYGAARNPEYANKYRERIWFSPHCNRPTKDDDSGVLFHEKDD